MNAVAPAGATVRVDEVRAWMFDAALPFWSSEGFDTENGSFVEHLGLDGRNARAPFKRVRAQARQIYVFSHAELLGWRDGRDVADQAWRFLLANARRGDGGWVRRLSPSGAVLDATCDAYDMAFVLFAHAWRYRVTCDRLILASALETVEALDRLLRHPGGQGWLAKEGATGRREQNPHMHLLEAAVELALATGHPRFHELAREIAELFRTRVFDAGAGALREFFADDWTLLPSPEGRIVEPGHQLEWAWLLFRAVPVTGLDLSGEARALHAFAERFGRDAATGLVIDQLRDDGTPLSTDARLWPQTEALKASLAMMEHENQPTAASTAQTTANLLDRYLAVRPFGTWIDHLTGSGEPRVDRIPSTSLYHLFLAFSELLRLESSLLRGADPIQP